jgi:hypothetical protein
MLKKTLLASLVLILAGHLSAAPYSQKAAFAALGKILPKEAPRQFVCIPVESNDRPSDDLLEFFRAGRGKDTYLGVFSPKLKYVKKYVSGALALAKDEKFEGVTLLICADKDGTKEFETLLKDTGIKVICTTIDGQAPKS